jgi:hypothetical protein
MRFTFSTARRGHSNAMRVPLVNERARMPFGRFSKIVVVPTSHSLHASAN